MAAEVVIGLIASSLALIADAGHMLSDAAAIALALIAMRLAARPAAGSFTYGLRRAEIFSAQANGLTLLLLAVFFAVESIRRLLDPPAVEGGLVLAIALVGVVVNLAATWVLSKANRQSLNVEGSFQHILTDLYAFIGTAIAGLVILLSGWDRADPIASLVVAVLMAKAGLGLVRESGRVFLEAAPRGIDPTAVEQQLRAAGPVVDVHELHIWEVSSGFPAMSAHVLVAPQHVLVAPQYDCHRVREELERGLADRFGINHTTLQVDHRDSLIADPSLPLRGDAPQAHAGHSRPMRTTGDHPAEDCREGLRSHPSTGRPDLSGPTDREDALGHLAKEAP
ncbi:cobalt-zinc-cadmium efflux system protein [Modestobacter sp. DSM 44400]|nr:cobalt-zinc-cadmium efflux system protein [Modestobacter sp. DSM 44400]